MPTNSRAQRRRQNAQQAARANAAARRPSAPPLDEEVLDIAEAEAAAEPIVGTPMNLRTPVSRPARSSRRPATRTVLEPVDYTEDYVHARRDLLRILLWSVVLFAAMIALRFSGVL
jgi:uncharacterized membrane protein